MVMDNDSILLLRLLVLWLLGLLRLLLLDCQMIMILVGLDLV